MRKAFLCELYLLIIFCLLILRVAQNAGLFSLFSVLIISASGLSSIYFLLYRRFIFLCNSEIILIYAPKAEFQRAVFKLLYLYLCFNFSALCFYSLYFFITLLESTNFISMSCCFYWNLLIQCLYNYTDLTYITTVITAYYFESFLHRQNLVYFMRNKNFILEY